MTPMYLSKAIHDLYPQLEEIKLEKLIPFGYRIWTVQVREANLKLLNALSTKKS